MNIQIAGFRLVVDCPDEALAYLPNWAPFVLRGEMEEPVLCRLTTACPVVLPGSAPSLVSRMDVKLLRIWLDAAGCYMSLAYSGGTYEYRLHASREWTQVQTNWVAGHPDSYAALNDLLMLCFIYSSAFHHTVVVHASGVAVDGQGAVFIGPSGIGKSTHSRLWLRHVAGAWLLNDDQPVFRLMPDGTVWMYGSPWSGKTPCYINKGVELKSLFFMEQAPHNRLLALSGVETFRRMMPATSLIGRDTGSFSAITDTLAVLSGKLPGRILQNRPDEEAARLSFGAFSADRAGKHTLEK